MRVLLPDEGKGAAEASGRPSSPTVARTPRLARTSSSEDNEMAAGLSPDVSLLSAGRPSQHSRATTTDVRSSATHGEQRFVAAAARPDVSEPSTDNVKDEGRDVGESSTAAHGKRATAGTSACDVAAAGLSTSCTGGSGSGSGLAMEDEIEKAFEADLKAKGWELRRQEGDGNCLFRAISQQIYGDPGMHGDIRRQCLDFMRKERDHYSQFVSEAFDSYVSRKEKDGVHGNNPEMQAASELFNRPIEVYVPEKGTVPINIFHGGYRSGNAPIRVSYHGGNHYNAVIDPEEASVGQGLGIPGLSKEAAEKESLKRALAESCSSAHQVLSGESPAFYKGGLGAHASFGADFGESDLRATEEELEQAAITASLADFHGTPGGGSGGGESSNSGKSAFSIPRRGGRGIGPPTSGRFMARERGAARGSLGRGERERRGADATWASAGGSPGIVGGGAGRISGGAGVEGGAASNNLSSGRKRRRPGSPPENSRKASPSSGDGSTSSVVREMVWSYGFPLARVLQAHDLVGDSVEDMLVLLTTDAFQPPEPNASA